MVWDTNKNNTYESFWECFEAWEEKSRRDSTIDLFKQFRISEDVIEEIRGFLKIEE
jgi:hypothetical protein